MSGANQNFKKSPIKKLKLLSDQDHDENPEPHLFKLNVDCLDKMFDYLSMKDLHSFGQTCKAMRQVAGEYFKLNFTAAEKFFEENGIFTVYSNHEGVINERTQTAGFKEFIQFMSHYYENQKPLRYLKTHCSQLESLNHIYLVCLTINENKISYLQDILHQLEVVQVRQCAVRGDIYDILLQFCRNVKRLYIQDDVGAILNNRRNSWLLQTYPKLFHLELSPRYSLEIHEMKSFFELNPNVTSFTTNSHCLWANKDSLFGTTIKLNSLEIKHFESDYHFHYAERVSITSMRQLLNQLHNEGFYKRLHLYVKSIDQPNSCELALLNGLEQLTIGHLEKSHNLCSLENLKELSIYDCSNATDFEILAIRLKLEKVYLCKAKYEHLLSFVRHSVKLNTIKISFNADHFDGALNLSFLNKQRKQLTNARMVIIYVDDNIFLATKWATRNSDGDLDLVEMRRANALCWDFDYSSIRRLH